MGRYGNHNSAQNLDLLIQSPDVFAGLLIVDGRETFTVFHAVTREAFSDPKQKQIDYLFLVRSFSFMLLYCFKLQYLILDRKSEEKQTGALT